MSAWRLLLSELAVSRLALHMPNDDNETILYCWILGDDPVQGVFAVSVGKNATVVDLKSKICQTNPHSLANVDHKNLRLWKVSIPEQELASVLGPLRYPQEIEDAIRLDSPLAAILEYFQTLPRRHLHIIVTRPDGDWLIFTYLLPHL